MRSFGSRAAVAAAIFLFLTAEAPRDFNTPHYSEDYVGCDGYAPPSADDDGLMRRAALLPSFSPQGSGASAKSPDLSGAIGIAHCISALEDLGDRFWMRKVSLLRARAGHRLDNQDWKGALADLDLADAAAKSADDPFYARSMAVATDFVRAYALRRSGDMAGATKRVERILAGRPYNREAYYVAEIVLGPSVDKQWTYSAFKRIAKLAPVVLDDVFMRAFYTRHYADALALRWQIAPHREFGGPYDSDKTARERELRNVATAITYRAARAGVTAYALAATGKPDEANQTILDARAAAARDAKLPEPLEVPAGADPIAAEAFRKLAADSYAAAGTKANLYLDTWSAIVRLRNEITAGKALEVAKSPILTRVLPRFDASLELLEAMEAKLAKSQIANPPLSQTMREAIAKDVPAPSEMPLDPLFNALPEVETLARMPPYEFAKRPLFAAIGSRGDNDAEGYRLSGPDAQGVTTVRFRGDDATQQMVEELALLRTAELARSMHKTQFVIVGRRDFAHRAPRDSDITPAMQSDDANGFEVQLDVLFADPKAPPSGFKDYAWRIFDAEKVYNDLAPVYLAHVKSKGI